MPIGVNLTSNVVRVFCGAIKTRSPGAPRIVAGEQESSLSSPFLRLPRTHKWIMS